MSIKRFFLKCAHCETPLDGESYLLCRECSDILAHAQGPIDVMPYLNKDKCVDHHYLSIKAGFLLTEPVYSILKTWKKRGGLLWKSHLMHKFQYLPQSAVLVPVPQSAKRSWELGRQPSWEIAEWIAKRSHNPIEELIRTVPTSVTKRQGEKGLQARLETKFPWGINEESRIPPEREITVIDDFCTTGGTLTAMSRLLSNHSRRMKNHRAWVLGYKP